MAGGLPTHHNQNGCVATRTTSSASLRSAASTSTPRTLTPIPDGSVVAIGGENEMGATPSHVIRYVPERNEWWLGLQLRERLVSATDEAVCWPSYMTGAHAQARAFLGAG